ncbi:bidirectional sugar transporter SWEET15-like [Macadamia integrifolia]|uniref:bidirectional sugar transporter SWEET15-like n=1 Tax=Macadamia integrifolia TaxID=60698 RepID=UPI001C4EC373|nr:bidirectional sugar transporter SWEET15-like [Macadamia integrifolia]
MPFSLSLFLTLSAIMWLCYGVLLKDLHVALPNILGSILGVLQMVLYAIYKDSNKSKEKDKEKQQEHNIGDGVKLSTMGCSEVHPFQIDAESIHVEVNDVDDDHQNKPVDDHTLTIEISTPMELPTLIECQA